MFNQCTKKTEEHHQNERKIQKKNCSAKKIVELYLDLQ